MPILSSLQPGTRFRVREAPELTGTLISASESRAVVRIKRRRGDQDVEFTDGEGTLRKFQASLERKTSWSATVVVDVIGFDSINPEENSMSTSTKKRGPKQSNKARVAEAPKSDRTAAAPKTKEPKAPKTPKADGTLSCLDAAAQVLASAKSPMTTKAMIEAMAEKNLWTSPGGKTPAATLYSAILREINTKGKEARFKKTERGHFERA